MNDTGDSMAKGMKRAFTSKEWSSWWCSLRPVMTTYDVIISSMMQSIII